MRPAVKTRSPDESDTASEKTVEISESRQKTDRDDSKEALIVVKWSPDSPAMPAKESESESSSDHEYEVPDEEKSVEVPVEYVKTGEDTSLKANRIPQEELPSAGASTQTKPSPAASTPRRPLLPSYSTPSPVSNVLEPSSAPRDPADSSLGDETKRSWFANVAETGIVPATPSEKASASPTVKFAPSSSPYPSSASFMSSGADSLEVIEVVNQHIPVNRNQLVGSPAFAGWYHRLTLGKTTDLIRGRVALSNIKLMIDEGPKTKQFASGWELPEHHGSDKSASVSTGTPDSVTASSKTVDLHSALETSPRGQKMGSASPKKEHDKSEEYEDSNEENRKPLHIPKPKRTAVRRASPSILKNRRSSMTRTKRYSKSIRRSVPRSVLGTAGHVLAWFLGFLVKFAAYVLIAWLVINVHVYLTTPAPPALRDFTTTGRLLAAYFQPTCPSTETTLAYEHRCFKESLLQIKNSLAKLKWSYPGRSDGTS